VDADDSKKGHHSDQKFAEVISQKTDAVSEFAKKKSYREQRQYLPIFAVRNEVLLFVFLLEFIAFCNCSFAIMLSSL